MWRPRADSFVKVWLQKLHGSSWKDYEDCDPSQYGVGCLWWGEVALDTAVPGDGDDNMRMMVGNIIINFKNAAVRPFVFPYVWHVSKIHAWVFKAQSIKATCISNIWTSSLECCAVYLIFGVAHLRHHFSLADLNQKTRAWFSLVLHARRICSVLVEGWCPTEDGGMFFE